MGWGAAGTVKKQQALFIHLLLLFPILFNAVSSALNAAKQYKSCKLTVKGIKKQSWFDQNRVQVHLICNENNTDNVLIQEEIAIDRLRSELFDATGTPLTFFPEGGGLVHINDHTDDLFELHDCVFEVPFSGIGIAPLVIDNARVRLVNCSFRGNDMDKSGGVYLNTEMVSVPGLNMRNFMEIKNGSHGSMNAPNAGPLVEIVDTVFQDLGGGAVVIQSFPYVHITGAQFKNVSGTSVRCTSGQTLLLDSSLFVNLVQEGQESDRAIGGVNGKGPVLLSVTNCTFSGNNMLLGSGGAVAWRGGGGIAETILHFSNCSFTGNKAKLGGAIVGKGSFTLLIEGSMLEANSAQFWGSAVYATGDFEISVIKCIVRAGTGGSGGGIYAYYTGSPQRVVKNALVLESSVFEVNSADFVGGAVYLQGGGIGGVDILDSHFVNNAAGGDGGALYLENVSVLHVDGARFVGNVLVYEQHSGAGLYCSKVPTIHIERTRFEKNKAMDFDCEEGSSGVGYGGGALFLDNTPIADQLSTLDISNCTFDSNHASAFGGDLYLKSTTNFSVSDTVFKNALARRGGSIEASEVGHINIEFGEWTGNKACGWNGGAIHILESDFVSVFGTLFEENSATREHSYGGAIHVAEAGDVKMDSADFIRNSAGAKGGAVYIKSVDSIEFVDCTFHKCEARYGGAVRASRAKEMGIFTSMFSNNTARTDGGGAIVTDNVDDFSMAYSFFRNSHAEAQGGALYSKRTDNITINASYFESQTSGAQGGSIYAEQSQKFTIENSKLTHSKAEANGGGVGLYDVKKVNFSKSVIVNSHAGGDGGGIWVKDADSVMLSTIIVGENKGKNGSGMFTDGVGDVTIEGADLHGNEGELGGGALDIQNAGAVTITGCKVANNTGSEGGGMLVSSVRTTVRLDNVEFDGNKATVGGGGAVLLRNVTSMSGDVVKFVDNEAASDEAVGALLMEGGGKLNLTSLSIVVDCKDGQKARTLTLVRHESQSIQSGFILKGWWAVLGVVSIALNLGTFTLLILKRRIWQPTHTPSKQGQP